MSELTKPLQKVQNQIILQSIKETAEYEYLDESNRFFVHSNEPFTKDFFVFLIEVTEKFNCTFCVCFVLENIVSLIITENE